jgi:hypothetical protein
MFWLDVNLPRVGCSTPVGCKYHPCRVKAKICHRRFILPPDLHEDPTYTLDSSNWDSFNTW